MQARKRVTGRSENPKEKLGWRELLAVLIQADKLWRGDKTKEKESGLLGMVNCG